jgi:hypothetical protein
MNHLDAQKIAQHRKHMLSSLLSDISPTLSEALEKKIEYEHQSLLAIIEIDTKADAVQKELNKTLKAEYFVQKKLDISHI